MATKKRNYTIDLIALNEFAKTKNGLLLSTAYSTCCDKLEWQCSEGHTWFSSQYTVKKGHWCPQCSGCVKHSLSSLQEHALSKGGKLLSPSYENVRGSLLWECAKGHQWFASWGNIASKNQWCPVCAGQGKPSLEEIQAHAKSKGGKLLSEKYKNNKEKLLWECSEGHQWLSSWTGKKNRDRWCPVCAGTIKATIKELRDHAKSKGGKLISSEYKACESPVTWECSEGHTWKNSWNNVKNKNQWCPHCAGVALQNISALIAYGEMHSGKLLSDTYLGCFEKYRWRCSKGHEWENTWASLKNNNSWCPECSSFKTELECKTILEKLLGIPLRKTRFLYREHRLEFDGYNEEHKIALEYNGEQHYKYPNYWHSTEEIFNAAKARDALKEEYCKEQNIKLIIVPYTEKNNLRQFLETCLLDQENN